MKKYEMLKQLQNEMMEARTTVEQLCSEWNWTLSDKETVTNEIVINKGKVTAIEITKEDNSTIEMLRETVRQMNQNMNDMIKQHEEEIAKLKEQYEQQMLDMTSEFEYEYECAINKREEQIKELEEKLDFKELLLSEFRDNMDEKIETIHELEDKIDGMEYVHRGVVAGYEGQLQNKQLTIESLEKQIADAKEDKARAEIIRNKNGKTIEIVDDPDFNDEPEGKPVVKETKEEKAPKQTMRHKNVDITLYDVHRTHDGAVRGYTKDYEFAWNGKSNVPAYKTKGMKNWHPMIKEMYAEALYIKEQVKDMFKETKETKITKEVTVNQTKEITIPTQKPNRTIHVTNGATISLPIVEAPEDEFDCGNTDDIDF